jgi:hypothetical protein
VDRRPDGEASTPNTRPDCRVSTVATVRTCPRRVTSGLSGLLVAY